jgi:hypothetical protein
MGSIIENLTDTRSEFERVRDGYKSSDLVSKEPEDLGNGILYFRCYSVHFAFSLRNYLGTYKNIRVTAATPVLGDGAYGNATVLGYVVVTEQR